MMIVNILEPTEFYSIYIITMQKNNYFLALLSLAILILMENLNKERKCFKGTFKRGLAMQLRTVQKQFHWAAAVGNAFTS